jgi:hypothetical protein
MPRRSAPLAVRRLAGAALLTVLAGAGPAGVGPAGAQSLRGSKASVERSYRFAVAKRLPFYRDGRALERAARDGHYARLTNTTTYRLRGVGLPYVLPATRDLLIDVAARYRRSCRERLVVTSAIRLTVNRLINSSPKSVHPTGLAFDLRAPRGRCRQWLRRELLALERRGLVDATEERFPPHLHVVVFRAP